MNVILKLQIFLVKKQLLLYLKTVMFSVILFTFRRIRNPLRRVLTFSISFTGSYRSRATRRHIGPDQRADGRREAESSDAIGIRRRLYDEERPRGRVRHGEVRLLRVL